MSEPWLARLYRLLLRAYPRRFRMRYGEAMVADARSLIAQRRSEQGARGVLSACWVIGRDLVASVTRERFGSRDRTTIVSRKNRRPMMLTHDVAHGFRVLLRAPGFALAAIMTVALGIGATTAIFSVLYAVVLRPLPFPEPERLVRIWETTPQGEDFATSPPNVLDYRERNRTLEEIGALTQTELTLTGVGEPQLLHVTRVTPNVLSMLEARPLLGRTFTPEEERPGSDPHVVVIGEGFWQSHFGGSRDVIGRTLMLNGAPWTIIGVLPSSFTFLRDQQGWVPLTLDAAANRGDHRIAAIGRLRAGVSVEQATADLRGVAEELGRLYPQSNDGWSIRMATFPDWIVGGNLQTTMVVLQLAAGLLLLMACANVAHLLLVRAFAREREMGIRAALGASRGRIVTQLLSESLLLALLAGVAGVAVAYAGVPLLMRMSPPGLPRADDISVNALVLVFAIGVSGIAGLLFGLLPALHLARPDVHRALRSGTRVIGQGGRYVREALLAGELALATMLLIGATLLLTSFARLNRTDVGFAAGNVLAVPVGLTSRYYNGCPTGEGECDPVAGATRLLAFMRLSVDRIEALPGVQRAGATNITPLRGNSTGMPISVEGYTTANANESAWADWRAVTAGFFEAAGLPLTRGRTFTAAEESAGEPVVIVSESLARRYWPNADPLGKRIAFGSPGGNWQTVIGVARDMRDTDIETEPREIAFIPQTSMAWPFMTLLIRTEHDPETLVNEVRRALWSIDPALPLPDVRPLESFRADALAGARFSLLLMGVFAAAALLLGVIGVYGVTYFTVSRRTREFGLRLALGARRGQLLTNVLRGALRPVLLGVLLGVSGASFLSGLIEALLYGTNPVDATAYVAAGVILVAVALCASALPAWRASRVDPRQALAAE